MLQWYTSIYYTQLLGASNTNSLDLREIKLGHKTVHLSILNEFSLKFQSPLKKNLHQAP